MKDLIVCINDIISKVKRSRNPYQQPCHSESYTAANYESVCLYSTQ